MRRSIILVPISMLLLAGCWPFGRNTATAGGDVLTLCVENATAGYGNVIARAELTRFDVLPGQTVCKRITPSSPSLTLTARTTSGGAAGPLSYAMNLPSTSPGCWHWRLGNSTASALDLTPCQNQPTE
jgi:hypothetical protein